jgi:hypothetical protein
MAKLKYQDSLIERLHAGQLSTHEIENEIRHYEQHKTSHDGKRKLSNTIHNYPKANVIKQIKELYPKTFGKYLDFEGDIIENKRILMEKVTDLVKDNLRVKNPPQLIKMILDYIEGKENVGEMVNGLVIRNEFIIGTQKIEGVEMSPKQAACPGQTVCPGQITFLDQTTPR